MEQEPASCVLWYLLSCVTVSENDLGQDRIGSAADAAVQIVPYLPVEDVGVRPLGGEDQVDAKGPALPGNGGQLRFQLPDLLLPRIVHAGLVQHLGDFVTGEDISFQMLSCAMVVLVNIGIPEMPLTPHANGSFFRLVLPGDQIVVTDQLVFQPGALVCYVCFRFQALQHHIPRF